MCITTLFTVTFSSCSDDDENRAYESVQIVGVKVNNELYTPSSVSAAETTVLFPPESIYLKLNYNYWL